MFFGKSNIMALKRGPAWRVERQELVKSLAYESALTDLADKMQSIIEEYVAANHKER